MNRPSLPRTRLSASKSGWFTAWLILWAATVILLANKMRRGGIKFGDQAAYYGYWGGVHFLQYHRSRAVHMAVMQVLHARLQMMPGQAPARLQTVRLNQSDLRSAVFGIYMPEWSRQSSQKRLPRRGSCMDETPIGATTTLREQQMLGMIHTILGAASLLLGGMIFLRTKGTHSHVRIGWAYFWSMLCVNVSSLFIYRLTGTFNLFHMMAIISLLMIASGILQVRLRYRLRNGLRRHYQYMSWSYVGLLAATVNEAFVRVSLLKNFAQATTTALPLFASMLIVGCSAVVIFSRQRALLLRYDQEGKA